MLLFLLLLILLILPLSLLLDNAVCDIVSLPLGVEKHRGGMDGVFRNTEGVDLADCQAYGQGQHSLSQSCRTASDPVPFALSTPTCSECMSYMLAFCPVLGASGPSGESSLASRSSQT